MDQTSLGKISCQHRALAASSPSLLVGVCSDPGREAATIGSAPTDGEGGKIRCIFVRLQSRKGGRCCIQFICVKGHFVSL
jgi:hypothetical protein